MDEKIKEKIVKAALVVVLISIAFSISYAFIRIIYAISSFDPRTNTFDTIFYSGTKIFQYDLIFPLGVFLVLSSYLPSFETHAKKLRVFGIIIVLFMHFGNVLHFLHYEKLGIAPNYFVLYGILLISFYTKKWLPVSMIVLGSVVVIDYLEFIRSPYLGYFNLVILEKVVFGLIVATVGFVNLKRSLTWMNIVLKLEVASFAVLGIYWSILSLGGGI